MKLTFVDLFAGVGMARMGMEQAGFKCVYTCEFDKHKRKDYEIIHGNKPEGCDIRDVRAADIPRCDVWFFGAPCQDFSIAGLRKGLDGERSSLVGEVFRLIEEKAEDKPTWLVYENVKGMLSSNYGYDFLSILLAMDGLGYDIEWQTFNSKDFGVPQNRERVYTIGHLRAKGRKQILPITADDRQTDKLGEQINSTTITARYGNALSNGTYIIEGNECEQTGINQVASLNSDKRFNPNQYRVYDTDGLSPCLNTAQGGGREPHVLVKSKDRSCNQGIHGVFIQDGKEYTIRKLTPKECMRLQGVPDEYTDKLIKAGISDSQIYKAAGDGLSVPIAKEIGERIKKLT
jgi:DNA (cytosine-5)-methyltransferase 1